MNTDTTLTKEALMAHLSWLIDMVGPAAVISRLQSPRTVEQFSKDEQQRFDSGLPFPLGLPELPQLPEGFNRWVYRGLGWKAKNVTYASNQHGAPWTSVHKNADPFGIEHFHYIEALP